MEKSDDTIAGIIADFFRSRLSSAALGIYGFFWLAVHAQGIYATFFVSQDLIYKKYGLLKNEYVYKYFFGYHDKNSFNLIVYHGHTDWHFLWGLILPLLLTAFFIWVVQRYLLLFTYAEDQNHKNKKRIIKLRESGAVATSEKETAQKEKDAVTAQRKLQQEVLKAEKDDPTIVWSKEYDELANDSGLLNFQMIINAVYSYSGNTKQYIDNGQWVGADIPGGVLAHADSNGLIVLDNKTGTLTLTDKGKYFVKRYSSRRKS